MSAASQSKQSTTTKPFDGFFRFFKRIYAEIRCLSIRIWAPSLRKILSRHDGRLLYKWDHFIDIYDRHFSRFRGKAITLVEVGVFQGGSLQIWREYFGPKAVIYGIDVDSRCAEFSDENTMVILNDQASRTFWEGFKKNVPKVDIFIDDGGHFMNQQIVTFEEMYPHLKDGGVYICEDLLTSYWDDYDGGLLRKGTFIEYAKALVDKIHAWHSRSADLQVDNWTKSIPTLEFHTSILVIEKAAVTMPKTVKFGHPVFPETSFATSR